MITPARFLAPLIVGVIMLIAWEAAVRINAIPPYILPGPILVAERLKDVVLDQVVDGDRALVLDLGPGAADRALVEGHGDASPE